MPKMCRNVINVKYKNTYLLANIVVYKLGEVFCVGLNYLRKLGTWGALAFTDAVEINWVSLTILLLVRYVNIYELG